MMAPLDTHRFGPWALVTGASSGIGREFARQLAARGLHLVLVARRRALLEDVGRGVTAEFGVQHRVVVADLSDERFLQTLATATEDLDIGLVVSNAGTADPGEFLGQDREALLERFRLNAGAHLELAHHFGRRLAARGRGGLLLCGAMGATQGLPFMANDSASKAYVQTLGEALHVEFARCGLAVTVLIVGPTETPIIAKLGLDPSTMPMKPMSVQQCVHEGLDALRKNRATHLSGRANRIMQAIVPTAIARRMMGKMLGDAVARRTPTLHVSGSRG